MRLVARGCFQEVSKLDSDTLYASTSSLVTLRLMLTLAIAISLADISTAFLHALLTEEVFVIPPVEYFPRWKLLMEIEPCDVWLKTVAAIMAVTFRICHEEIRIRRCKSDSNLLLFVKELVCLGVC